MNQCVVDLFWNPDHMKKLTSGLPEAFEIAAQEFPKGNPSVGVLREHAVTGFFQHVFGMDQVKVAERGNGFDVMVCGSPLSIKTVTGNVGLKVIRTCDTIKTNAEVTQYRPSCDLLRIYWGACFIFRLKRCLGLLARINIRQ